MELDYAASFGKSSVTHAIKGEWSYDAISSAVTVCGRHGPFHVNHADSGPVEITCKTCIRLSSITVKDDGFRTALAVSPAMMPAVKPKRTWIPPQELRSTRVYASPVPVAPNAHQRRVQRRAGNSLVMTS